MGRPNQRINDEMAARGYLPAADAARTCGFTLSWVHRLATGGQIDAEKVGASWYVDRRSLARRCGPTLGAKLLSPEERAEVFGPAATPKAGAL